MPLLTLVELKARIDVGSAGDDELNDLLTAEEQVVLAAVGALGDVTEYLHGGHGHHLLSLAHAASAIVSATEDDVLLAADDYALSASGQTLRRLADGTNPRWHWGRHVTVVLTRLDDTTSRKRVQAALIELDLSKRSGLVSQQIGTWTETYQTGLSEDELRSQILASLTDGDLPPV